MRHNIHHLCFNQIFAHFLIIAIHVVAKFVLLMLDYCESELQIGGLTTDDLQSLF